MSQLFSEKDKLEFWFVFFYFLALCEPFVTP